MKLNWNRLKVFHKVALSGSFTVASEELHLNQSSLSRQVANLEYELGCKLFDRSAKGVSLTNKGEEWFEKTSNIYNEIKKNTPPAYAENFNFSRKLERSVHKLVDSILKELKNDINYIFTLITLQKEETMKSLKILTTDSFASYLLPPIFSEISHKYPDYNISIKDATIDRVPDVDIYLLAYKHPFKNFNSEVLQTGQLCLYANGKYLEKYGYPKTLEETLQHKIIRPVRSDVLLKFGQESDYIPYKPIYFKPDCIEVDTLTSLIKLGESGAGIICYAQTLEKYAKVNLEKIPEIHESNYVHYTFGFHESVKDLPIVNDLMMGIRRLLN